MKLKKLFALALAGVLALALLTGCSDSTSKAEQVKDYVHYMIQRNGDYMEDKALGTKLEALSQKFQPDWVAETQPGHSLRLTEAARAEIRQALDGYITNGSVQFGWVEVRSDWNALRQAESFDVCEMKIGNGDDSEPEKQTFAFTTSDKKKDGKRYYLVLIVDGT